MTRYLRWKKEGDAWIGYAADRRPYFTVERRPRGDKTVACLRRHYGAIEVCSTIQHAREYADELARLANFPPID